MTKVILDFCNECGGLLPEGLGNLNDPTCPHCASHIGLRECRIQGEFEPNEARKLKILLGIGQP